MARRYFSSTAVATTLSGNINNSTTSITVAALSGYPAQTPFTAIIDPDTASEEVVEVTNVAGTTLTVTRGVDGTTASSHNAGAVFRHGVSARDFDEANAFVNGGGVANSLVDAKGDLITATADNTPARLAVGATNGHVLKVNSATATGLEWGAEAGIPATLLDAKGDLIVATADNTASRLAVGTNGHVLTADSAAGPGVKWAALPSSGALVLITQQSFTTSSAVNINNCFSSTYQNYMIRVALSATSGDPVIRIRLRASSTDATGASDYVRNRIFWDSTGGVVQAGATTSAWDVGEAASAYGSTPAIIIEMTDPFASTLTRAMTRSVFRNTQNRFFTEMYGLFHAQTTSYDGFSIYPSTGTFSGTIRVYGFTDS